ncbi:ABC transporter permease [Alkaliflexus imshenetskii]|uniref:ABC transporter permease n=1 Tax=Alkaliflexus imshenetskii TaxID=286730 RepID=UPI000479FF97|nr:ABC transporter permease [Alkaliflexus imshenetskii]
MLNRIYNNDFTNVLRREVSRIIGSRTTWFLILIGPLLSFFIVISIFREGVPADLPVAVVDEDNSATSRQLIRMIDATRIASVSRCAVTLEEARESIFAGTVEAVFYIPAGMEAAVLRGEKSDVTLFVNNTNVVKGGLLQSGIYRAVNTLSTGVKMQTAMKGGAVQSQALEQVYPVRLDSRTLFNPFTNYAYFLATALMPLLIVVFTLLGAIYAIGLEIRNDTGKQWLNTAGDCMVTALAGKLVPYIFMMLFSVSVMNYLLVRFMDFPFHGYWGALILGQILLIVAYQMVGVVLLSLTGNTRLSLSLASAYSMMAFTFSGLTFPVIGMPLVARFFAHLFPFYYWMDLFIGQGLKNAPMVSSIAPLLGLLIFCLLGWMMTPRLKRVVLDDQYRYKI